MLTSRARSAEHDGLRQRNLGARLPGVRTSTGVPGVQADAIDWRRHVGVDWSLARGRPVRLVSDDLAKARWRRANDAAPEHRAPLPFDPRPVGRERSRGIKVSVPETHAVQTLDGRAWMTVHLGSEASCARDLDLKRRHWPDKTFRMVTIAEATAEARRKTWSVRDADHIPNGERVMLLKTADELHPSIGKIHKAFGIPDDHVGVRYGVIKSRYRRSGDYMVALEGTMLTICVRRDDLVHPIPDNVLALEPDRHLRKRRPGQ